MSTKTRMASRSGVALAVVAIVLPALVATSGGASIVSFTPPKALGGGSEPEVTVAADGTIFIDAPTGLPGHSALWRVDPGKSPKQLSFTSPYNRFPGGGDSAVALAPGNPNKVYFLDLWGGSNSLQVSNDNGETWSSGTPFTTLPPSDRQWIAAGKQDTIYVNYHHAGGIFLSFAKSTDGGLTWTHGFIPGVVPTQAWPKPLWADGDFVATDYIAAGGQIVVAWSNDAGATWKTSKPQYSKNANEGIPENMVVDGDDVWLTYVDGLYNIQVTHGTFNATRTDIEWERAGYPTQVSTEGSNIYPWIAARDGKVVVSWYGDPQHAGQPDGATGPWNVMYSQFDGRDEFGNVTFTAPVVAAANVKGGPICTMGTSCTANRELGDFQTIALDAEGKAVVAFVRNSAVAFVREN